MKTLVLATGLLVMSAGSIHSQNPNGECDNDMVPYAVNEILYIERNLDEEISLDTTTYLPEGFNPYASEYESLEFIENSNEVELGFDTASYLPANFDPYAASKNNLETYPASAM